MNLYESNYLRLSALCGDFRQLPQQRVSRVGGQCDLVLALLEHTVYTSALTLSYLLPRDGALAPALESYPDLRLRIYHDARLVEAEGAERELHQRFRRNLMLNKWLEYCVDCGHRFAPAPGS
ncbi:MAG: DUF1249 domain-containing protein [Steroidobacteraceae bacterium]